MLVALVSAFTITCTGCWWLVRNGSAFGLVDHPNERSLHDAPTPRSGGLAIWAGLVVGTMLALAWLGHMPAETGWIAAAVSLVGIVSLMDDRSHLPAGLRLVVHGLAGGLLVAGGLGLESLRLPGFNIEISTTIGIILALILILWLTNLYNFMDGMDGLAGGMAVCGFGVLGLLGWLGGDAGYAVLCGVVAAAAGGFLVWNFPPARIFMGDSGASVLGLLAAALALWGDRLGLFPLWVALLAFAPFIVDATLTLARRLLKGQRVWEAHRDHYYQRLARAGWGHRGTVRWEYALMLLCAVAALVAVRAPVPVQYLLIAAVAILLTVAVVAVRGLESRLGSAD